MSILTGDVNLVGSQKMRSIFFETVKFVIVGLISFAVDYVAFLIFNRIIFNQAGESHTGLTTVSNIIAYCIGILVNYVLIRLFVFTSEQQKENGRGMKAFISFIVFSLIGMILTIIFTSVFMELFENLDFSRFDLLILDPDSLGKICATLLVTAWNFFSKKVFIFK